LSSDPEKKSVKTSVEPEERSTTMSPRPPEERDSSRLVRKDSAEPDHVPEKDTSPSLNSAEPEDGPPDISILWDSVALETPRSAKAPPGSWNEIWTAAPYRVSDSLELET